MIPLTPEHWDFRGITDAEVEVATRWEYLRSSDLKTGWLSKWLKTKVKGKPIFKYLMKATDYDDLPQGINPMLPGWTFPGRWIDFDLILGDVDLFPYADYPNMALGAWMDMSNEKLLFAERHSRVGLPLMVVRNRSKTETMNVVLHPGWNMFHVDFKSHTLHQIRDSFAGWVTREMKAQNINQKSGKAAQVDYSKLKALAALRLKSAGMNAKQIQEFTAKHKEKFPKPERKKEDGKTDLNLAAYPDYKSKGAFHDAFKAAEALLAEFAPK